MRRMIFHTGLVVQPTWSVIGRMVRGIFLAAIVVLSLDPGYSNATVLWNSSRTTTPPDALESEIARDAEEGTGFNGERSENSFRDLDPPVSGSDTDSLFESPVNAREVSSETSAQPLRTPVFLAIERPDVSPDPVSLRPEQFGSGTGPERWSISQDYGAMSIRDALRLLLRVDHVTDGKNIELPARYSPEETTPRNARRSGSAVNSILDIRLTPEALDLLFGVLSPNLEPDGAISFSVAGMGNFVMVLSEEIGALKLIDLDNGRSLTLKGARYNASGLTALNLQLRSSGQPQQFESQITIKEFMLTVRKFLFSILQDNRFIGITAVFGLIWIVWRIYRRGV